MKMSNLNIHETIEYCILILMGMNALCRHIPYGRAAVRSSHQIFFIDNNPIQFLMNVKINQTCFYNPLC